MKKCLLLLLVVLFVFTACDNSIKPIRFAFDTEYEKLLKTPLTIEFTEDGGKVTITNYPENMRYSKNDDGTKYPIPERGEIPASKGEKIRLYANGTGNPEKMTSDWDPVPYLKIMCNSDCEIYGNIMSLFCKKTEDTNPCSYEFEGETTVDKKFAFMELFKDNTHITSAVKLLLPATTLTDYCYARMFAGCTNLTKAPELLATTMATYCYAWMFQGCTSLTQAPNLPARKLAKSCYTSMFQGCTKLTEVQEELPATDLTGADFCYGGMFSGCQSLIKAPNLPARKLAVSCYSGVFQGCTKLTEVQSNLPADTLVSQCYLNMFKDCASLKTAPSIDAQKIGPNSCQYMFENSGLTELPYLCVDAELGQGCYQNMFKNCDNLEKAILPKQQLNWGCYYGMFENCDNLTEAFLPATDLTEKYSCYKEMFKNCPKLESLTCLATTHIEYSSTYTDYWLDGAGKNVKGEGKPVFHHATADDWPTSHPYGVPSTWHQDNQIPPQFQE